jgi:hypothetical protein
MNNDAPETNPIPVTPPFPIPPLPAFVRYSIAFGGGAVFAIGLVILFSSGHSTPAVATPPVPPTTQPKTVQVVTLFNCQYLSFTDPFFILHLPKCTNHPPER